MKTAARVQVPYNPEVPQYVEGHEDFNVWYGKYLSDRRNPRDKDRYSAGHTCDPEKDSGWTQADLPGSGSPGFCLFYARGCCGFGHKCRSLDRYMFGNAIGQRLGWGGKNDEMS